MFLGGATHSPSMLLGMYTGLHNRICVNDIGLDNKTVASGLAVGRPSGFVGRIMEGLLDGIYTVSDQVLQDLLRSLYETESIFLEPSALAGMIGPYKMLNTAVSGNSRYSPDESRAAPLHLVWATGGGMVPESVRSEYLCSI
ncbi:PALP domain-containing protein [Asaia prunellae]|uniref:pyridoxal-phosphate dependent enzyme n=1 Tax=Asaia prunellae TaxID=610245 RepID=UPI001FB0D9E1|nr:pyridoxal-phosphate dependent enzyme [Asaia prunellae]